MPTYRLYTLGQDGRISHPAMICDCEDDEDAIKEAGKRAKTNQIEVWQGTRKVAALRPPVHRQKSLLRVINPLP
jgi:hypothetical protein